MTNETITNLVFLVGQAGTVVASALPWDTQVHMFMRGCADGFPLAFGLAIVWAIVRAVIRPPNFPSGD